MAKLYSSQTLSRDQVRWCGCRQELQALAALRIVPSWKRQLRHPCAAIKASRQRGAKAADSLLVGAEHECMLDYPRVQNGIIAVARGFAPSYAPQNVVGRDLLQILAGTTEYLHR